MSESSIATRATIQLGTLIVDGFMLSDGSYRMSLTQCSGAVGVGPQNASDFLDLKAIQSLLGQGYTVNNSRIEIESSTHTRGRSRFRAMSLDLVAAYWQWQALRGNHDALALCVALMNETLTYRFDTAFDVKRSDLDYNQLLGNQVFQLEAAMARLRDAYVETDQLRDRVGQLEQQLRDADIEPLVCPACEVL